MVHPLSRSCYTLGVFGAASETRALEQSPRALEQSPQTQHEPGQRTDNFTIKVHHIEMRRASLCCDACNTFPCSLFALYGMPESRVLLPVLSDRLDQE